MPEEKRPSIDPATMLVFAAIARSGGVRGAGVALGLPRSTVSRRLAQLEAAVGAPLVVRTSRRFALTDLGRTFAAQCESLESLVAASEELVRRAAEEPMGTLRVDAAPVLAEEILPDVLVEIARRYPRLAIELRTTIDYVDLRKGEVDVVLRARPIDDASDLFASRLATSLTGCYASPSYVVSRGLPHSLAELAAHDCILVGRSSPASWTFGGDGGERTLSISGRLRVDNFRIARELAARGLGILRTANVFAAPLVASGDLVPVLERHWWKTPIFAAHAGPNPPAPKVRAFLSLVRQEVARVFPKTGAAKWRSV